MFADSRAAGVATPGMAPSMLSALVGSMEQVIADRAANCRALETARAKFLDAFTGATFADYPGTLLDGHQMAVVMLAAALLHPGAPIVGLLNLPSIRALFGAQPGSGRGHYLQVAVKGVGVYTFRDTGECTLKRADGTVQALDQSPTLLAIALHPNAGPLQFVDPPQTYTTTNVLTQLQTHLQQRSGSPNVDSALLRGYLDYFSMQTAMGHSQTRLSFADVLALARLGIQYDASLLQLNSPARQSLNREFIDRMEIYWADFHSHFAHGETHVNTLLATFVQALPLEAALKLRLRLEQAVDVLDRTGDYEAARRLFSFDCEGRPWSNYDTITPDLAIDYKRMVSDQGFNYKSISKHITKMNKNIAQNAENALTYPGYYSGHELNQMEYHLVLDGISPLAGSAYSLDLSPQYYDDQGNPDYSAFARDIAMQFPELQSVDYEIWVLYSHNGVNNAIHLTQLGITFTFNQQQYYGWHYEILVL